MIIKGINRNRGFEPVKDAPDGTLLPVQATPYSAGFDFFAPCDILVPAKGFSELIKLNIKAYMLPDEYLGLNIRSSLATTKGKLQVSQGEAIIDADYYGNTTNDGNICVMFENRADEPVLIKKGERCCQGIFKKWLPADNAEVLNNERSGGHGSTGV